MQCSAVPSFKLSGGKGRTASPRVRPRVRAPSRAGHGENGFLDLGQGEMPERLQIDVRDVGYLVRRDGGIDNRGSVNGERLAYRPPELARLPCRETVPAAGARESGEVGVGKLDAFAKWR